MNVLSKILKGIQDTLGVDYIVEQGTNQSFKVSAYKTGVNYAIYFGWNAIGRWK